MKRLLLLVALGAASCKKPAATVDAGPPSSPASVVSVAQDAGDPFADDEEFGAEPDAGCPILVHPGYCRRSCKPFRTRSISRHAARVTDSARSAIGTCDKFDVFAERDGSDAGIVEYYDSAGNLVAARDDRLRGCKDFGSVPTCTPVLTWKPSATVKFGQPTVTGNLPPEVVARIVRQRFALIRACYQSALDRDPSLRGTLTLSFAIPAAGDKATVTKAKESTVTDAPFAGCVVDVAKEASFPAPIPASPTTATMTITFGPQIVGPHAP